MPVNIGLEWRWQTATNTLAFYSAEFITVVKSFREQARPKNDWLTKWIHLYLLIDAVKRRKTSASMSVCLSF